MSVHAASFAAFYFFLVLFIGSLGGTTFTTGLSDAVGGIVMFVFSTAFGWLADRYGGKIVLLIGMYLDIAALIGFLLLTNPWQVLFVQALVGLNGAAILTGSIIVNAQYSDASQRGQTLNANSAAFNLGTGIGPLLGGFILSIFPGDYILVLFWAILIMFVSNVWCHWKTPSTPTETSLDT